MKRIMRLFMCLCLMLPLFMTHQTSAAATCKKLFTEDDYFNRTFTSYDITGDGKKDRITFKGYYSNYDYGFTSFEVYVNGSRVYSPSISPDDISRIEVYYIQLKNGKKYLLIDLQCIDEGEMVKTGIYKYQSGKLVRVKRLDNAIKWSGFEVWILTGVSVSKNTITARFISESSMFGAANVKGSFSYANSSFNTPTTLTYSPYYNENFKSYLVSNTSKAIPVYKKAGKSATVTKIKKGAKFYPLGVKKVGSKVYYRVKVGKKKGYIASNSSYKFKYTMGYY